MLQAISDGIGRWVAGAIMALIAVAFVFWGVDFTLSGTTFAAKVNGNEIPLLEFERDLQNQQAQYQELYRLEITDDLQRELRRAVLERLIRSEALLQQVESAGYRVSDERLTAAIRGRPEFQVGGEFSLDVYRASLLNLGLTPAGFEALQREQLSLLELQGGIMISGFYTAEEYFRYVELYKQRREIAYALFAVDDFLDQATVDEAAILAHYEANKAAYYSEESVDLEYIELQGVELAADVVVTEEELEAYYEDERYLYQTEEERQARHILIGLDTEDAEAIASAVLTRLGEGEDFEALVAEFSEDAGTSGQGGDLGWVSKGLLVGPFEDTLFSMEVGAVEGPVETGFGYHIIRLDDIRPGEIRTFESVRDELAGNFRIRRAEELFYNQASELADRAFDSFDELATVATQMDLPLQTFSGFTHDGTTSPFPVSAPVVQAAFSPETLGQRENSGPIELADDHVVVLRVSDHHPPAEQPLEVVREEVEQELVRAAAQRLAEAASADFLAELGQAEDIEALAQQHGGAWTAVAWVERTDGQVPTEVLATAFRLAKPQDGAEITELVPVASGDYAVLVLSAVEAGQAESIPREERILESTQLAERASMSELTGYSAEIRDEATI
ncbi:MAG: SurA N-terminal domain-containing protein, partial [Gammaproteobacteria bacterium]